MVFYGSFGEMFYFFWSNEVDGRKVLMVSTVTSEQTNIRGHFVYLCPTISRQIYVVTLFISLSPYAALVLRSDIESMLTNIRYHLDFFLYYIFSIWMHNCRVFLYGCRVCRLWIFYILALRAKLK